MLGIKGDIYTTGEKMLFKKRNFNNFRGWKVIAGELPLLNQANWKKITIVTTARESKKVPNLSLRTPERL